MRLRELKPDEFFSTYPFIKLLNPTMSKREFTVIMKELITEGFRIVGAFEGTRCLGICGYWIGHKFYCRKHLHIDAFVVDEMVRSKGVGKKILDWLERKAKAEKCNMVVLDTYVTNTASHKFYHREDYIIAGYHFLKKM